MRALARWGTGFGLACERSFNGGYVWGMRAVRIRCMNIHVPLSIDEVIDDEFLRGSDSNAEDCTLVITISGTWFAYVVRTQALDQI